MSVSVYFSNQIVQVAVGKRGKKGTLQTVYSSVAPEGCIINGIVMDPEVLGNFLNEFWILNNIPKKDVYLVVKSNKIASKNLYIPVLDKKKTFSYITREFSDMQREEEENTIAYTKLKRDNKKKQVEIYAEMAPKEQLREFMNIFSNMGVALKGIISAEGSIIGYVKNTMVRENSTFILQVVNGNLVSNILIVEGEFTYYNSVRCFNEVGTPEYLEDLARSLNQLQQFMSTQKITAPIERIFVAGTENADLSAYNYVVSNQGVNAPCELVNTGIGDPNLNFQAQRALFAYSGLFDQGIESNFLTNFDAKKEDAKVMDPAMKKRVITIATTLAVMLILFGFFLTKRLIAKSNYDEYHDYNSSPTTMMKVADYEAAVADRDAMQKKYNSINTVVETIDSYPVCTDEVIETIEETAKGYADVEILSFDAESGHVSFTAKSKVVGDIYKYIDRLLDEEIFMNVEHTGYTLEEKTNLYNIHVECILAPSVGREEE
ncbi:MAG: hypothetical protein K5865_05355 [Eubacterium sp.]|nr:hypothetical protein [Eubacterium sp.]